MTKHNVSVAIVAARAQGASSVNPKTDNRTSVLDVACLSKAVLLEASRIDGDLMLRGNVGTPAHRSLLARAAVVVLQAHSARVAAEGVHVEKRVVVYDGALFESPKERSDAARAATAALNWRRAADGLRVTRVHYASRTLRLRALKRVLSAVAFWKLEMAQVFSDACGHLGLEFYVAAHCADFAIASLVCFFQRTFASTRARSHCEWSLVQLVRRRLVSAL